MRFNINELMKELYKILIKYILLLIVIFPVALNAQEVIDTSNTTKGKKQQKAKTGFTWGGVPVIAYDSDVGFKYGLAVNLYHFGDGKSYPEYHHSLYLEWSRTTKGSGINQLIYDSKYLIPKIRVNIEASYFTEQALDFYGFNGYESFYNPNLASNEDTSYISRMYYRLERNLLIFRGEFQGHFIGERLQWLAGISYIDNNIHTVNITKLNKGEDEKDRLPDTTLLYDNYVQWGIITNDEKNGGKHGIIKLGLVYDTRDNEPNPMKGIWTDIQFVLIPGFLSSNKFSYGRYIINHRQYFTLVPKVLNFAGRISYQGKLFGDMPFYMLPFSYGTPPSPTRDALGGAKTIRGVLRDRVVGNDFFYGNLELRWKFLRTVFLRQNFYIALTGFFDGGMITHKYLFNSPSDPDAIAYLDQGDKESLHMGAGSGLHFVFNENFNIAFDYGRALDRRDGISGFYVNFNFLY